MSCDMIRTHSRGHNILELYVLVQVGFTTSKTKRDSSCNILGILLAKRIAERLKTEDPRKLENTRKNSNLDENIT